MVLSELGDIFIHEISTKLAAEDIAILGCVNKHFKGCVLTEERLWIKFCYQELNLTQAVDHLGNPAPSFKVAYQKWREAFIMYPWHLVKRVKRCWDSIKSWIAANIPEAENSILKGVSEAKIIEFEETLGVKLPLSTKILYRFCDGQAFPCGDSTNAHGLIGGYSFYNHQVNTYLLSLSRVTMLTQVCLRHLGVSTGNKYIVIAASPSHSEKMFLLNCTNGQLYVGTKNLLYNGEMIPCVPLPMIKSVHDAKSSKQQNSMLLWLEEHARRLHSGVIGLRQEGILRSINLFPETSPLCSVAVTNGVKIRSSAVFVPELSNLQDESNRYWFSYSIRLSLQMDGCRVRGIFYESCQLFWRHWIIYANDVVVSDVNGEAVIGKYPLLYPGMEEFVYESCTPLPNNPGSVEGSFIFIPGSLRNPKDDEFSVEVAKFHLQIPDYIF